MIYIMLSQSRVDFTWWLYSWSGYILKMYLIFKRPMHIISLKLHNNIAIVILLNYEFFLFPFADGEIEDLKRRIGDTIMQIKQDSEF